MEYPAIAGFEDLYLEDSWVLDITVKPYTIEFIMDLVLTQDHPAYNPPAPNEQYCYRHGRIVFDLVRDISWRGLGAPPATDASGQIDFGNIDSFQEIDGRYQLEGDWGQMIVDAGEVKAILDAL